MEASASAEVLRVVVQDSMRPADLALMEGQLSVSDHLVRSLASVPSAQQVALLALIPLISVVHLQLRHPLMSPQAHQPAEKRSSFKLFAPDFQPDLALCR